MYYFYHIRKSGGRSIIHSFMSLVAINPEIFYEQLAKQPGNRLKRDGKIFVGWDISTLKRSNFFFAFSHAPAHSFVLPHKTNTITCIRDPLKRLMSYYNYLIDIKKIVRKNPKHAHVNMPDLAWAYSDPMQFLKNAPRRHLLNQLFMFSKQMKPKEAIDNISKVKFILHIDHMVSGIKKLSRLINLNIKPLHIGVTKTSHKFSDEFVNEANHILQPEFDLIQRITDRGIL